MKNSLANKPEFIVLHMRFKRAIKAAMAQEGNMPPLENVHRILRIDREFKLREEDLSYGVCRILCRSLVSPGDGSREECMALLSHADHVHTFKELEQLWEDQYSKKPVHRKVA